MTLLFLLLGHFLGDFWLQSDRIAQAKTQSQTETIKRLSLMIHVGTHVFITLAGVILYGIFLNPTIWQLMQANVLKTMTAIAVLIIIAISHYGIDTYKGKIAPKIDSFARQGLGYIKYPKTTVYLLDQCLHIAIICVLLWTVNLLPFNIGFNLSLLQAIPYSNIVVVLLSIIILTSFSGYLIECVFDDLTHKPAHKIKSSANQKHADFHDNASIGVAGYMDYRNATIQLEETFQSDYTKSIESDRIKKRTATFELITNDEVNNYGKLIGYFERILVFVLLITGYKEGIAILVTVKTFSRFKQLDSKKFTEKYILGTFMSVALAIVLSLWVRHIIV